MASSSAGDVAHAFLTSLDSSINRAWREEDAAWHVHLQQLRAQDIHWMETQRRLWASQRQHRLQQRKWREYDTEQRSLENARSLWLRFVERNRRDVEEKSEQLKAISNLAALFAGFAIVTLTQVRLQTGFSKALAGLYGVLTAIVEGLMTISMVKCTLILGNILKVGKAYVNEEAEEKFIFQCRAFFREYNEGDHPPCPRHTLEAYWDYRCEASWQKAFHSFSLGVSLFLLSLIVIGWIQYSEQSELTAILFISLCGIAILLWCLVHYAWNMYVQKQHDIGYTSASHRSEIGFPDAWYLAPHVLQSQQQKY